MRNGNVNGREFKGSENDAELHFSRALAVLVSEESLNEQFNTQAFQGSEMAPIALYHNLGRICLKKTRYL